MIVVPFKAEHLDRMAEQPAEKHLAAYVPPGVAKALEGSWSKTIVAGDEILLCGGVTEIWQERGYLWVYLSADIGNRMLGVHRRVRKFINAAPFRRVEAAVQWKFEQGHQWMKMLGFTCETPDTPMRAYLPDGGDAALYAKVKG